MAALSMRTGGESILNWLRLVDAFVRPTEDGQFLVAPFGWYGPTYLVDAATTERFKRIVQRYSLAFFVVLFVVFAAVGWWFVNRGARASDLKSVKLTVVAAIAIPLLVAEVIHLRLVFRSAAKVSVPGFPPGLIEIARLIHPRWFLVVLTVLGAVMTLAGALAIGYAVVVKGELPHLGLIAGVVFIGAAAYMFFRAAFGQKAESGAK